MKATTEKQPAPSNTHLQQDFFKQSASEPFFGPNTIQPKLTIGQPNDKYEREADAVADRVVNGGHATNLTNTSPNLQTMCADCAQEEGGVQRMAAQEEPKEEAPAISKMEEEEKPEVSKMAEKEEEAPAVSKMEEEEKPEVSKMAAEEEPKEGIQTKPLLMRKTQNGASVGTSTLAAQLNSSKGSGQSLPKDTNRSMSQSFGTDFSGVRIHTNNQAQEMNQGLNARAFTHGSDIYFNQGEYSPGSSEGKRLLAHELTHVVQQGGTLESVQKDEKEPTQENEEESTEQEEEILEIEKEVVLIPIETKDKDTGMVINQSAGLELGLKIRAPLSARIGKFKFNLLKPEISAALRSAYEHKKGVNPNISFELEGGISVTIVEAKLKGNMILPKGSKIKFSVDGEIGLSINTDEGKIEVEPKIKPKIKIEIPLSKRVTVQVWGVLGGGGLSIVFEF